MVFKAVAIVGFTPAGFPHDEKEYKEKGIDLTLNFSEPEEEIIAAARDADAIITLDRRITRNVIGKLTKCKLIHNMPIGYEYLDVNAATEYGICVSTPADYCLEEVSDHAMALLLACARKIVRLNDAVRAGKWDSPTKPEIRFKIWEPMFRIRGQTLGLIAFGNIARTLVPKARGFGLRIIAFDPYVSPAIAERYGVELVELGYLLANSDYISVHAPLGPKTHHMLGLEEFKKMKPTAYLIHTSRGPVVDQEALYTALTKGYIAGAGLDVIEGESIGVDHPLLKLDNVILTAHSAHYSYTSNQNSRRRPFEEISRIMDRKWPRCLLNPQVKEAFVRKWGEMQEDTTPD